jgi:hypothetical protein
MRAHPATLTALTTIRQGNSALETETRGRTRHECERAARVGNHDGLTPQQPDLRRRGFWNTNATYRVLGRTRSCARKTLSAMPHASGSTRATDG